MKHGSLFTGYGGLDLAIESAFGTETIWHAENDPAACRVLEHRYPDVPNLGDVEVIDWSTVPAVDLFGLGFPCQDVSQAGKKAGLRPGTRSGLWAAAVRGIDALRPTYVVIENVRGLLSACAHSDLEPCPGCVGDGRHRPVLRALSRVLGDLAELGYDARWCGLRASDVGAPHERFREFILATYTGGEARGRTAGRTDTTARGCSDGVRPAEPRGRSGITADPERGGRTPEQRRPALGGGSSADAARGGAATADTDQSGPQGPQPAGRRAVSTGGAAPDSECSPSSRRAGESGRRSLGRTAAARRGAAPAADTEGDGRHEGRAEPAGQLGRPDAAECGATASDPDRDGRPRFSPTDRTARALDLESGNDADGRGLVDWGRYGQAIRRWGPIVGRVAPAPTEPGRNGAPRLAPRFVEWMMGLADGWVTDVPGLTRNDMLRILGNGVVPQQAEAALWVLSAAEGWRWAA